jgi:hypothetical protein
VTTAAPWLGGGALSFAAHGVVLAVVIVAVAPAPRDPQPMPQARIDIAAYPVDRTEAAPEPAVGDAAAQAQATGTAAQQGSIPVSQAAQLPTVSAPVAPSAPQAVAQQTLPTASPATKATPAPGVMLAVAPTATPPLPQATVDAPTLPDQTDTQTQVAAALPPPAQRAKAELAWSGKGSVDPVSLSAIQSFLQPGDLAGAADTVRDGVEGLLASVPCSRLQTRFVPETDTLELRGHIPEDALRAPILTALQAQMGSAIPVSDQVLILPRPQCGALAGISAVGLPQSTDQLTDPRVVGPDAHVREYRYIAGQRLAFELTAPDYDSVVYIDYFDANGMVIHLQPNDTVPLAPLPAKARVTVGMDTPGKPSLAITIAPPFGQEIAVAFATSAPLYDGLRPTVEPAEPYLRFLREQVALAREQPGFKGEWVYFFMTTAAQ